MEFLAVDAAQSPSAATIVFEALRRAIIEGTIEDGAPLRQEEIARAFNTSRIPVREALARLEQIGLVESRRYKGAHVAAISLDEVDEIFDLRALVEADAIRRAVRIMPDSALAEAEHFHKAFAAASDPMEWTALNRQFHCSFYLAGRSPNYMAVIGNLLDRIDRYLRAQLALTHGREKAAREHALILEACRARDAERAARLTHDHVQGAKHALIRYLKEKDERPA